MEKIRNLFMDPLWWFSIIFIGVIVSLFASYIRTVMDKVLSKLSLEYKKRRERKQVASDQEFQLLTNDVHLIVIEIIKSAMLLMSFWFALLFVFLFLFFAKLIPPPPGLQQIIPFAMILLSFGLCFYLEVKTLRCILRTISAYKIYKHKSRTALSAGNTLLSEAIADKLHEE